MPNICSSRCLWFLTVAFGLHLGSSSAQTRQSPIDQIAQNNSPSESPQQTAASTQTHGRAANAQEIAKKDLPALFGLWLDSYRVEHDLAKRAQIGLELSQALQSHGSGSPVYAQFQTFVLDPKNTRDDRLSTLKLLGAVGTKEAIEVLLAVAASTDDKELKEVAGNSIKQAGLPAADRKAHEERSVPLERAWNDSNDQFLLLTVGGVMVEIGAPHAMKLLLSAALSGENSPDWRKPIATRVLNEYIPVNVASITLLADLLNNDSPTDDASQLSSYILARMTNPEAGKALVNWFEAADSSAATLIRIYVANSNSISFLQLCRSSLYPSVVFRHEENREAIRAGLKQSDSRRIFSQSPGTAK
jgi:hypothetical protein